MKPLLTKDSPLYLKRLARALNEEAMTGNGFYFKPTTRVFPIRGNKARLRRDWIDSKLTIQCRQICGDWHVAELDSFSTASNCEEITASRVA